jgi:TldD protein
MTSRSTRRQFLTTTSLALAGTTLRGRQLRAQQLPHHIGMSSRHGGLNAAAMLPESLGPAYLRTLAVSAADAAKRAGASYADVRVAERHRLHLDLYTGDIQALVDLDSTVTYGVRVIVDGTWAFVHGSTPSIDAITTSARDAVATARGYAKVTRRRVELVPMPIATGEWETPIQEDPFAVPLQDHAALMGAYDQAALRVRHGELTTPIALTWIKDTRVFASSDGSLTTQRLHRSEFDVRARGNCFMGSVLLRVPQPSSGPGGFETVTNPALQDEMKRAAEEVVRLASLPSRAMDVGRYPVVFDGATLGMVLGRTLGAALELDRVLGYEADASGTSFLSPPQAFLGTEIVSPLLTVIGNHPSPTAPVVKWDDEGVEPHVFPIITRGRLLDYPNSRQTASALQAWYAQRGQALRSHGCMVAPEANDPLLVRTPHVAVVPSANTASIDELCKGITRGVLVLDMRYCSTDQQLSSGSLDTSDSGYNHGVMLEIEKGKVVRRIGGNSLEFRTSSLWKSQLVALGDAYTVCERSFAVDKGMPWRTTLQSAAAPAGLFKDVNIISTQRSL